MAAQDVTFEDVVGELSDPPGFLDDLREKIGKVATRVVRERVGDALSRLMQVDVRDIVAAGFTKHDELVDAANKTASIPGSTSDVTLFERGVEWARTAHLEVTWSGKSLRRVEVQMLASATLLRVTGAVTDGRLVSLGLDDVELTAELRLEGVRAGRGSCHLGPDVEMPLGEGIELVAAP